MNFRPDNSGRSGSSSGGRRYGKGPAHGGSYGGGGGGGSSGGRFGGRGPRRDDDRRGPPRGRASGQGRYADDARDPRDISDQQDRERDAARPMPVEDDLSPAMPLTPIGTNARQVAFGTLLGAAYSNEYVTEHLERAFQQSNLPPIERRLATELTYGVVRRKNTLDALLQSVVTRPRENVEPALWMLLRVGAYQLVLCDGIAEHAACDETVELARWLDRPEWIGFTNGVLRSVTRLLLADVVDQPAADSLPTTNGRFRKLTQAVLPDPATNALSYVSKAFSLPHWLVERWSERSDFAELCRLGFWFNTPSSLCLRVNRLRTDRDTLLGKLAEQGISAHAGELPDSIWLDGSSPRIDQLPSFAEGGFVVQDESAQRVAALLAPQPGQTVLDLCSAPGTKTTHLAELMNNEGRVIATDTSEPRLQLVQQNSERLGLSIIETAVISQEGHNIPAGPFDAILIDAPCSNTGVLCKRPDARWRILPDDLEELSRIQLRLLMSAADRVRPGGRIVYSTCSIEPEENQQVVEAARHFRPKLTVVEMHELKPGQSSDGGFQCLLRCD